MNSKKLIGLVEVDFVFVHMDPWLLDAFVLAADGGTKKVNVYADQQQFLDHVYQYPKDTKIVLGRTSRSGEQTGIQIARYLHELGLCDTRSLATVVSLRNEETTCITR